MSIAQRVNDDERARTTALTTRAATIAGFDGTILAVLTALGGQELKLRFGSVGDPLVRSLFLLSALALATSATLAVGGVLHGRRRKLISVAAVQRFADREWVTKDAAAIGHEWLVNLGETLARDRTNNDRRAQLGKAAAIALLVGLLAVAGQAVVLGVDAFLTAGSGHAVSPKPNQRV